MPGMRFQVVVSRQVRLTVLSSFAVLFMSSPALCTVQDGWALCAPEQATREVLVRLIMGATLLHEVRLPVGQNALEVKDHVITSIVSLTPDRSSRAKSQETLTDTWLGSVDSESAWLRFMWWQPPTRDGKRIANELIVVPLDGQQSMALDNGVTVTVKYLKVERAQKP